MDDPPKLTVASSRSEQDLATQRRMDEVRWATNAFTANWLRVMRGAGRPHYMISQLFELATAIKDAVEAGDGYLATIEMENALRAAMPDDWLENERLEPYHTISRGVLQLLASKLVGQATQQRTGETEIMNGIREMESYWERERAKWAKPTAIKPARKRVKAAREKVALAMAAAAPTPADDPPPKPKSTAEFMKLNREGRVKE